MLPWRWWRPPAVAVAARAHRRRAVAAAAAPVPADARGSGQPDLQPRTARGTPKTGGTLTVLGTGRRRQRPRPQHRLLHRRLPSPTSCTTGSLYTYPSVHGQTFTAGPRPGHRSAEDQLTTACKYTVTIRTGAMWDTSPPRQVNAADVVRGVKRSCNPTTRSAASPTSATSWPATRRSAPASPRCRRPAPRPRPTYINSHQISGVSVDPKDPADGRLHPDQAGHLLPGRARPAAVQPGARGDPQVACRTAPTCLAARPCRTARTRSSPTARTSRSCSCATRPGSQSTDPIRHAYVDQIDISETGNQQGIYQQILTNSPAGRHAVGRLRAPVGHPGPHRQQGSPLPAADRGRRTTRTSSSTPSRPNNNKALAKVAVRQAISYAIDRTQLVQDGGGPVDRRAADPRHGPRHRRCRPGRTSTTTPTTRPRPSRCWRRPASRT